VPDRHAGAFERQEAALAQEILGTGPGHRKPAEAVAITAGMDGTIRKPCGNGLKRRLLVALAGGNQP
jgi:hypothetical protein